MNPHDAPSAAELVESVREWIERDVMNSTSGRLQFHARVAINVLAIVERELRLGTDQAHAHARRMAELGVNDEAELALAIRNGDIDPMTDESVREAIWATVRDKLRVANPKYLNDAPG